MPALRILVAIGLLAAHGLRAGPPGDYYARAQGRAGAELRAALHETIRNHRALPYASSQFDTSDALRVLDEDPRNTQNVWLLYAQRSEPKSTFGLSSGWNREHQWPDSYGLDGVEPAYSDLHNLRAEDATVNSSRGNKYYDASLPTDAGYRRPAHAESPLCASDNDSWEPPEGVKGDIARSLFYMSVRYNGDIPGEPRLQLTDAMAQVTATTNLMGRLSTLVKWHVSDPVSAEEMLRNDRVFTLYQANRNPFVDHPEWVVALFVPSLTAVREGSSLVLSWPADGVASMVLEQSSAVGSGWSSGPPGSVRKGGVWTVALPLDSEKRYFRLRLP
jgi:endonuclease I